MSDQPRKVDDVTGVETTRHVWDDDIRELDNPLPRWWLYTFYACIVWSVGYWILYPAWPTLTGYTKGTLGHSERAAVASELLVGKKDQEKFRSQLTSASLSAVRSNPELLRFAMASGGASFQTNCAPCHGRGAQGFVGYPNLNDDDWIWGGKVEDIVKTLQVGIRSDHKDTRMSQMPRFGVDKILKPEEISAATHYVLSLSQQASDPVQVKQGEVVFTEHCAACHGADGRGNIELGAPNLADTIWLYGSSQAAVRQSIETGRGGVMPAWADRLDPTTIKSLAIYVHSLGGGR
jgi:cytochrome c oxidase cbb3-type subunit III